MTICELCGYPMVWSMTHLRVWCSVYGDHPTLSVLPPGGGTRLVELVMEAPNNTPRAQRDRVRSLERYRRLKAVS